MSSSGLPLSLLSVGALALASQLPAGSFAFGHEGHWGSAGAGILLVAGNGKSRKVLVLLRSQDVTEPGFWNLAGGAVDRSEDPLEAGLRELEEETALRFSPGVARDHLLGQTVWHSPNGRFRYTTSVIEVPASAMKREIELNWENDEHQWVDADWLRENEEELHPGFRAKMDELIAIAFPAAPTGPLEPEMAGSAARAARARAPAGSWAALLATPVRSAAAARRYLDQLHAFGLDYHPEERAANIVHRVHGEAGDAWPRLFTDEEAALADARMDEVHQYLPDPSATLLGFIKKAERAAKPARIPERGSRGTSGEASTGIVVISVTPHRVGFSGHAVVRNLSRGRPHDPRAIHHVEVTLGSDDPALLRDDRKVHRAAKQAAAGHGASGQARIASGVYPAGSQAGPKYRVRVDVA